MLEQLKDSQRILMEVPLRPAQGDRFQPTGFADLGGAVYERADGRRLLLVESAQSVANRLEATCLDGKGPQAARELEGLPYIVVELHGKGGYSARTSSLVEAHRLNSPYIISDEGFRRDLVQRMEYRSGSLLDWPKIAAAIFRVDPCSLLHGVFMANLEDGRVKLPRIVSGFIEAEDVREAASGGV